MQRAPDRVARASGVATRSPRSGHGIHRRFVRRKTRMRAVASVQPDPMSAREAEVLDALRDHLTNAEIGQRLHISVRTVESHVSSLLRKLGASDRRDLAARAEELATSAAEGVSPLTAPRLDVLGLPSTWTTFV